MSTGPLTKMELAEGKIWAAYTSVILLRSLSLAMTTLEKTYLRLAAFMGSDQDVAIFRRFETLNLLSLLSLQSEVMGLGKAFRRDEPWMT